MWKSFKKWCAIQLLRLVRDAISEEDTDITWYVDMLARSYAYRSFRQNQHVVDEREEWERIQHYRKVLKDGNPNSAEYSFARMALKGLKRSEVPDVHERRPSDSIDPALSGH